MPNPNRAWNLPELGLGLRIRVPKKYDVAADVVVVAILVVQWGVSRVTDCESVGTNLRNIYRVW